MKKAFTFLELIFVVVIVGILSVIAFEYFNKPDYLVQAVDQAKANVRYAQHLALSDDKYATDAIAGGYRWQRYRWGVQFRQDAGGLWVYAIFADRNQTGNSAGDNTPQENEYAVEPLTNAFLAGGDGDRFTPAMSLSRNMEITNVVMGCAGAGGIGTPINTIVFDEVGRPYAQRAASDPVMLTAPCQITFTHTDGESMSFCVDDITGYTHDCV